VNSPASPLGGAGVPVDPRPLFRAEDPADSASPAGALTDDSWLGDTGTPANTTGRAERRAMSGGSTLVIEGDVSPRRLRRPADLLRFAIALSASGILLAGAYFASGAASGLEADLAAASVNLPDPLVSLANVIAFVGVLLLPVAAAIDLLVRKRARQLLEAFGSMFLGIVLLWLAAQWIQYAESAQLLLALTGRPTPGSVLPLNAALGGIVTFITVARLIDRTRWAIACSLLLAAIILANVVGGGITVAALGLSALLGWSLGLLARYVLGTPTTRPSGLEVASAIETSGFPLTVLRASHETDGGRRYSATTRTGERMEVLVLDRDLEGGGLLRGAWRSLRLRDESGMSGFTMRSRLEHAALQSYASQAAGAPVPRLEAVAAVGPDAAALAYARLDGRTFSELGSALTDKNLDSTWRALRTLHDAGISHRALHAEHLLLDANGGVWLLDPEEGSIGAGDVAERLDTAELLCTLAMLTDPDRAVASGRRVLGTLSLTKALPVLQPVALTSVTRRAIKRRKDVLAALRESLEELTPEGPTEEIDVQRLRPRTILTVIAGTAAAYFLLYQVGEVDLVTVVREAKWGLAALALMLSAATYVGAAMSVQGFVPEPLKFLRTMQAQLAASFATLVSPPTLGALGVNIRYLQKSGVHPALAAASIGVSQVMAFVMHLLLVLGLGIIAGSEQKEEISAPPIWAVVVAVIILIALIGVFFIPWTRKWAQQRVRPILSQIGPRLLTLAQTPSKLATGIGGFLILNLGYCLCLLACVRAFDGGGEWAGICVVYLVGATVGQVAPTPGGLGAVETALTVGLVGVGVEAGIALSSVLLFRILTFWLPAVPGWFSFNNLLKRDLL
jgi:uncharacterized membrane protein YbhN (UPF0104 family)